MNPRNKYFAHIRLFFILALVGGFHSCSKDKFHDPVNEPHIAGWHVAEQLFEAPLHGVCFSSSGKAWAVGDSGFVYSSADTGVTWTVVRKFTGHQLYHIGFFDAQHGWISGDNGLIAGTSDGGTLWTPVSTPSTARINDVVFVSAMEGWAVGSAESGGEGALWHTVNGGQTWTHQNHGVHEDLTSIAFAGNQGWITGKNGTLLHSADGGIHWQSNILTGTPDLNKVCLTDTAHIFLAGNNGCFLASANQGTTWSDTLVYALSDIYDIFMLDNQRGFLSAADGKIWITSDQGSHWKLTQTGTTAFLYGVSFNTPGTGIAVGANRQTGKGIILYYK